MSFGCKTAGIVSIILILSFFSVKAQNLYVFDRLTNLPIKNVIVYNDNKSKTTTTDGLGIVDLSLFNHDEYINLQQQSYKSQRLNLSDIERMHFRIGLEKKQIENREFYSEYNWYPENNKTPDKIELIKKEDINFVNLSTAVDMLAMSNQVYIRKNQQGDGEPMIRGFSTNHLLYYLDGVKLNSAVFGNGQISHLFMVDVNVIEHTEIIFGPGNSQYGNEALGGIINFHSLNPKLTKSKTWRTEGNGYAKITSAEFEKILHADINFSNNKWALFAAISYSDFDDLKMGKQHNEYAQQAEYITRINDVDSIIDNGDPNVQRFSAFNTFSFISKVKQQFTPNVDWTLSYYLTRTNSVDRYDKLLEYSGEKLKYAENYISPQQWMMNSLEINFNESTKIYDLAKFVAAYQNCQEGINERIYKDSLLKKQSENVNVLLANLDFEKSLLWNNTISYGVDFSFNNVDSNGEQENLETGETEWFKSRYAGKSNKTTETGFYSAYRKVFDKVPVTISSGLRLSYVGLKSVFNDTSIYSIQGHVISLQNIAFKVNAGIVYHPDKWIVKLNLSTGFRAPNLDDAAKIYSPEPGNIVIPNENLKPEHLYNTEFGIGYSNANLLSIDFTTFFSFLDHAMLISDYELKGQDSIVYSGEMSKIKAVLNNGNAIIYGAALNLEWNIFKQLTFIQSITLVKSRDKESFTLRDTPPLFGKSELKFEEKNFKLMISSSYNSSVSYVNLPLSEKERTYLYARDDNGNPYAPFWWILDLNANYNFAENFQVSAGVDNILDYRYRPYSWGITAPGRNFKISCRYKF